MYLKIFNFNIIFSSKIKKKNSNFTYIHKKIKFKLNKLKKILICLIKLRKWGFIF